MQGIAVPCIFKHTITDDGEHKLSLTYKSLVFNLGGRFVIPPGYKLTAESWGKPAHFVPESYIRAQFASAPRLLLGRGIAPKLLEHCPALMESAAQLKGTGVWAGCSAEDVEWYSELAKRHNIPEAGQELRRSARLLGEYFRHLLVSSSFENSVLSPPGNIFVPFALGDDFFRHFTFHALSSS